MSHVSTPLSSAIETAARTVGTRTLRAVDYLRVSTEEQKEGYGVARQSRKPTRHIALKQWAHVGTYKGEGVSGSLEAADRGDLKRLMDDAQQTPRPFDIVVVPDGRVIGRKGRVFWRWVWAPGDSVRIELPRILTEEQSEELRRKVAETGKHSSGRRGSTR